MYSCEKDEQNRVCLDNSEADLFLVLKMKQWIMLHRFH